MKNKKKVFSVVFFSLLVLSLFSVSFASAGWFGDLWGRITGKVITGRNILDLDINRFLVFYWSFDNTTNTTIQDISGNNNSGIYANGVFLNTSCNLGYGNCVTFDGVNDFIGATKTIFNTSTFSASLWVYVTDSVTNYQGIIGVDNGYYLGWRCIYVNDSRIVCQFGRGQHPNAPFGLSTKPGSFQANRWNHLVVTRDNTNGNVSIYINGNLSASGISTNFTLGQVNFRAGVDFGGIKYLNGSIDELVFFNKALTSQEVQDFYNYYLNRLMIARIGDQKQDQIKEPLRILEKNNYLFSIPANSSVFLTLPLKVENNSIEYLFQNPPARMEIHVSRNGSYSVFTRSNRGEWIGPADRFINLGEGFIVYSPVEYNFSISGRPVDESEIRISPNTGLIGVPLVGFSASSFLREIRSLNPSCYFIVSLFKVQQKGNNIVEWWSSNESFSYAQGVKKDFAILPDSAYYLACHNNSLAFWTPKKELQNGTRPINLSCSSISSFLINPKNLSIEDELWTLEYTDYQNYSMDEKYYFSGWKLSKEYTYGDRYYGSEYNYISLSLNELSSKDLVEEKLNQALENGICEQRRIYMKEGSNYHLVYLCKDLYSLAYENQRVSNQQYPGNYRSNANVFWFNDNKLFNVYFSNYAWWACQTEEECGRRDFYFAVAKQDDLIRTFDKLLNNKMYVSVVDLDWRAEQFIKHFLDICASKVKEQKSRESNWFCRTEPVICPPHGEQRQICIRWNENLRKEETRETTIECNPGICSGCMVPRWFGDKWGSKCIQYGFRFKQDGGWEGKEAIIKEKKESVLSEGLFSELIVQIPSSDKVSMTFIWDKFDNVTYVFKSGESQKIPLPDKIFGPNSYALITIKKIFYPQRENENGYVVYDLQIYQHQTIKRSLNMYCDIDGQVKQQEGDGAECENNFECFSNECRSGFCVDTYLRTVENTGLLIKILCRITTLFGSREDYLGCLAANS